MKRFTRTTEDFTCLQCGQKVSGNGYTNHCPSCLWSKHVDNNPGDRAADCGGAMEPVEGIFGGQEYAVIQRCQKCGFERKNKLTSEKEIETFIRLMAF